METMDTDESTSKPSGPACASALRTRIGNDYNSQECYSDTGFSFNTMEPAAVNDIPFICKSEGCKAIIDLARGISTDECVTGQYFLYRDVLNPIIRKCANLTTTNATQTPSATGEAMMSANWTIATTAPPWETTSSPSSSTPSPTAWNANDAGDSAVAWGVGLAFAGLVVLMIFSIIKQKHKEAVQAQRDRQRNALRHGGAEPIAMESVVYVKIDARDDRPHRATAQHSPVRRSEPKPPASTKALSSNSSGRSSSASVDPAKLPLLQDQQITAVRVPFDKVAYGSLINRGGFGEVYLGTYKEEVVAIKKMLPEHRVDARLVNKFLEEIKLMASLEHEHIVRVVGVAWDTVSDLCALSEFMAGGDLRSLLERYEAEKRPQGFDRQKIKIALHVAHALTYMHSLQPVVLHRDLKSSNILLSQDLDAKITDFGVSRERADVTMTRGVGTSLWMAPEIMMGGRYDEKADVFSFGVVLSELDSNKLPYANQVDLKSARTSLADLMQSVAQGRLTVDFSYESDPDIVALGRDCVAVDPQDRPTAAEALHRVHHVLRQYQEYTVSQ